MVTSYIGLGSNLGDRQYYIKTAIRRIRLLMDTQVKSMSSIIETKAVGGAAGGRYLNCVIEIQTSISAHRLLKRLQKIEADLGRLRTIKNGPRTIDLDILLYGDVRIKEASLCIPHPRMLERGFVMKPLEEIAPEVVKRLKEKIRPQRHAGTERRRRIE
jgi:2-amino-4-hydroxy-6-hydroxymethyldihydropteridine diphosphokinase